ncbi:helix-turn-helix domain-containing protein [Novipirellula artificiosorum]|uniref:Helix-turn-helix protein n=1 Tax=Novipirellula artificiosorum TaxID=2528016 RepID=A0A5C6DC63_9BACT|nr:helix-turn-helix transcriptional regulator [Novipirellula artificiosorum]TWU33805.1 helix-turn-helix protein [Novipirellula artificiosorum]
MPKRKKKRKTIAEQLIEAIETSELSRYRLSLMTGISQSALSQFVNRTRDLSLGNAEKICEILKLDLKQSN